MTKTTTVSFGRIPSSVAPLAMSFLTLTLLAMTLLATWSCKLVPRLPFSEPGRLVVIQEKDADGVLPGVSYENYLAWLQSVQEFESVSAHLVTDVELQGVQAHGVRAVHCTANLFKTLGVEPILGRVFLEDERLDDRRHVAVLSHDFWQRQFAGKPDVVGGSITIEGRVHTILGVMPEGASYPDDAVDLWLPLKPQAAQGDHECNVVARLAQDVKLEQAEKNLVDRTLACGHQVRVIPLRDALFDP